MSISSKNISLFYDEKQILKDISIEIKEGKITTLLGPNGAGKSSFLNIISGDLDFYNGDVFYNQRNLAEINIQEKAFLRSVMVQSQPIIFDFSVKEIVEMGWLEKGDIKYSNNFKNMKKTLVHDAQSTIWYKPAKYGISKKSELFGLFISRPIDSWKFIK